MELLLTLPLIGVAIILALTYFIVHYHRDAADYPPGPRGHWLFGFMPHMEPRSFTAFRDLKRQYGGVVSIRLGMKKLILLLTSEAIREAFVKKADNFAGRHKSTFMKKVSHNSGILHIDGPLWTEHSKFSLRELRRFGFGRNQSESTTQAEAQRLVHILSTKEGLAFDPFHDIMRAVSCVISSITLGEQPSYDDAEFNAVMASVQQCSNTPLQKRYAFAFPFLAYFTFITRRIPGIGQIMKGFEQSDNYIREKIDQHRATIDWDGEARDFTDAYLKQQAACKATGNDHTFTDWQLIRVITEIFVAGTDTTSQCLNWFLLLLALHPEVQEKVCNELDKVVGRHRQPTMMDKASMPYLQATFDEVQRYGSVVPRATHRNFEEDTVGGYRIPASSIVIACLYSAHHDPDTWPEPEQFRPERFLSPDGTEYRPRPNDLIPFSLGRRSCMGESLAKMELFLFSVALMQRFSVTLLDEGAGKLDEVLLGADGITRGPEGHKLIFHCRE